MCAGTITIRFRLAWWARWLLRLAVIAAPLVRWWPRPLRVLAASVLAWIIGKGIRIIR